VNAAQRNLYAAGLAALFVCFFSLSAAGSGNAAESGTTRAAATTAQERLKKLERALGPEHPDTLTTKSQLAGMYYGLGDYAKAGELHTQVLEAKECALGPEHPHTALAVADLSRVLAKTGDRAGAIFYAKLAVETGRQQLRSRSTPEEEHQQAYSQTLEDHCRFLARLLIEDGRPEESQAALRLLKDDELSGLGLAAGHDVLARLLIEDGRPEEAQAVLRLLKDDESSGLGLAAGYGATDESRTKQQIVMAGAEAALKEEYTALGNSLAALGREQRALLQKKKTETLTEDEASRLDALDHALEAAGKKFRAFMDKLPSALEAGRREIHSDASRLKNLESLRRTLRMLGDGTVLVHTLSAEDKLYIFLTTPDVLLVRESAVGRKDLEQKIRECYALLRNPAKDPTPSARALYDIVLRPIRAELAGSNAKTLMFSLDGALRYIPMAALHDGERWLAESCNIAMFTEDARDKLRDSPKYDVNASALGLTKSVAGSRPLPAVRQEIESIISGGASGILPGKGFLDDRFTYAALSGSLRDGTPVLHIASHFEFDADNPAASYLLLGDGRKLSLSEINGDIRLPFDDVDQLTLSACDTASGIGKGDGREVEGFGAVAQARGAQSVVASLWPVYDPSTSLLMREFYHRRFKERQNKAQALRNAQITLMHTDGTTGKASQPDARGSAVSADAGPMTAPWPGKGYSHPYYWAPFILMGNWK
jgi:CHAT domain-containing protein